MASVSARDDSSFVTDRMLLACSPFPDPCGMRVYPPNGPRSGLWKGSDDDDDTGSNGGNGSACGGHPDRKSDDRDDEGQTQFARLPLTPPVRTPPDRPRGREKIRSWTVRQTDSTSIRRRGGVWSLVCTSSTPYLRVALSSRKVVSIGMTKRPKLDSKTWQVT